MTIFLKYSVQKIWCWILFKIKIWKLCRLTRKVFQYMYVLNCDSRFLQILRSWMFSTKFFGITKFLGRSFKISNIERGKFRVESIEVWSWKLQIWRFKSIRAQRHRSQISAKLKSPFKFSFECMGKVKKEPLGAFAQIAKNSERFFKKVISICILRVQLQVFQLLTSIIAGCEAPSTKCTDALCSLVFQNYT